MNKHLSTGKKLSTTLKDVSRLIFIWIFAVLIVASCSNESYANNVQQKAVGLVLADYNFSLGAQSAHRAFFVRIISMRSHIFMAKLERDTFTCAGNLVSLSANPFQLCHPYLAVIGKAPLKSLGAHTHA